jgi:DNA repair ATPase RecN
MKLLRNTDFKNLLHDYYGYEANQRQFQEIWFQWQLRHLELAAGIVSHEQETHIQDTWLFFGPEEMEEVRNSPVDREVLRQSVALFLEKQDLIDWLPQTRSMQLLQIRRNKSMLEKAEAMLSELQTYLDSIEHQGSR